jgi:chromosome segregation ATPase
MFEKLLEAGRLLEHSQAEHGRNKEVELQAKVDHLQRSLDERSAEVRELKDAEYERMANGEKERREDKSTIMFLESKLKDLEERSGTPEKYKQAVFTQNDKIDSMTQEIKEKDQKIQALELELNKIKSEQEKDKALLEQQLMFKDESLKQLNSQLQSVQDFRMSQDG